MTVWLDAFPHDWDAALEASVPGRVPTVVYYPGARRDGGSDGTWLRITAPGCEPWTGVFSSDNLPGFLKTPVKVMLVRAELDPSVKGEMSPLDKAAHAKLCASVGPNAKDGQGRCPTMLYLPRHSHVSEVFAFDSGDKTVEEPILKFARDALGIR